jgi:hypothetical protein
MSKQQERNRCIVHRRPAEAVEFAGVRITVYVPRAGRAVLVIESPTDIPVYRVDGAELTEMARSETRAIPSGS